VLLPSKAMIISSRTRRYLILKVNFMQKIVFQANYIRPQLCGTHFLNFPPSVFFKIHLFSTMFYYLLFGISEVCQWPENEDAWVPIPQHVSVVVATILVGPVRRTSIVPPRYYVFSRSKSLFRTHFIHFQAVSKRWKGALDPAEDAHFLIFFWFLDRLE
jgi:hypothetical protein